MKILPHDKYKYINCTNDVYYNWKTKTFNVLMRELDDEYTTIAHASGANDNGIVVTKIPYKPSYYDPAIANWFDASISESITYRTDPGEEDWVLDIDTPLENGVVDPDDEASVIGGKTMAGARTHGFVTYEPNSLNGMGGVFCHAATPVYNDDGQMIEFYTRSELKYEFELDEIEPNMGFHCVQWIDDNFLDEVIQDLIDHRKNIYSTGAYVNVFGSVSSIRERKFSIRVVSNDKDCLLLLNGNDIPCKPDFTKVNIYSVIANTHNNTISLLINGEVIGTLPYTSDVNYLGPIHSLYIGNANTVSVQKSSNISLQCKFYESLVTHNSDLDYNQKIVGYLAHKWGLADNLPDDHTWKAGPPLM